MNKFQENISKRTYEDFTVFKSELFLKKIVNDWYSKNYARDYSKSKDLDFVISHKDIWDVVWYLDQKNFRNEAPCRFVKYYKKRISLLLRFSRYQRAFKELMSTLFNRFFRCMFCF